MHSLQVWGYDLGSVTKWIPPLWPTSTVIKEVEIHRVEIMPPTGGLFMKIAGASGAVAILFGAYTAHGLDKKNNAEHRKKVMQTGANYHLLHSVALLSMPLARRPMLTASLMVTGMTLFSGTCYYVALTEDNRVAKVAPFGGILLVLAWLSLLL